MVLATFAANMGICDGMPMTAQSNLFLFFVALVFFFFFLFFFLFFFVIADISNENLRNFEPVEFVANPSSKHYFIFV